MWTQRPLCGLTFGHLCPLCGLHTVLKDLNTGGGQTTLRVVCYAASIKVLRTFRRRRVLADWTLRVQLVAAHSCANCISCVGTNCAAATI